MTGTERCEKIGRYHWRVGETEYRLTDLPSDPCWECGAEIPEESYCYLREGERADGSLDHICWDCGHEVTGFGDTNSNGEPFADGGQPSTGNERFEEWGVYLIGDSPLKAHGLALDDGSGDKKLLAEALEERLEDDEIDELINDLIAYRVDDGEDGTAIECEDCGHVRPTTEENPTLVNCQQCGSYNLRYKDDGLRADGSGEPDPLEDQREQVREFVDDDVIGYVAGDTEEAVTLCPDCEEEWDDEIPTSEIRDNPHYGDQVPYPECFRCGEVIRP